MPSFPLTINGQVFSNTTLAGKKYTRNYPDLLQAVASHSRLADWFVASMKTTRRYYPEIAEIEFTVTPQRSIFPGMWIKGETVGYSSYVYGVVLAYNVRTGLMKLSVQGYVGNYLEAGVVTFSCHLATNSISKTGKLAIADGGTNSGTIVGAITNLELNHPYNQIQQHLEDFTREVNATNFPYLVSTGTADYTQSVLLTDYYSTAGFLQLGVTAVSDNLILGSSVGHHVQGTYLEYQTLVWIPTLSVVGERFKFQIGLRGSASTSADIFDSAGIGFSYSDNSNSGKWLLHASTGGSDTQTDSGVTVVAGSWVKLKFIWDGTDCKFYIGATLVLTTTTGLPATGAVNVSSPAMQITKSTGSTRRAVVVDYVYLQKKVSR